MVHPLRILPLHLKGVLCLHPLKILPLHLLELLCLHPLRILPLHSLGVLCLHPPKTFLGYTVIIWGVPVMLVMERHTQCPRSSGVDAGAEQPSNSRRSDGWDLCQSGTLLRCSFMCDTPGSWRATGATGPLRRGVAAHWRDTTATHE